MTHTQCALCWINPVGFHAQDVGDGQGIGGARGAWGQLQR